ncbi:MAG: carbon-nitrogen hydrolase family protein [Clostridiaceae bacterium]|nr:carbon-nitrogen hydrolase family protein [Clostridiaceae bacterium]
MRLFALELNNDIKGIPERKSYIESLIAQLPSPDLVLLPELALCSYMASQAAWQYADDCNQDTSAWAMEMAAKYQTILGVGYIDYEKGDYFNRYLMAGESQVYGIITKSEAEAAVFKRGCFDSVIETPFGNVALAICYDARRRHFYENIKDQKFVLIVFPHGSPADPKKEAEEIRSNDYLCESYLEAFDLPVVYVNSLGKLEYMPGLMGAMMKKAGFTMNGKSKIYANTSQPISCGLKEAIGIDIDLVERGRKEDIHFYGEDIAKGNFFFRHVILKADIKAGLKQYEKNKDRIPFPKQNGIPIG